MKKTSDFAFLAALGERAPAVAYAGDPRQYVDSVINNLSEVDAVLPDSLGRPLVERIRLLLERANREASLAVELRQRAETAEAKLAALGAARMPEEKTEPNKFFEGWIKDHYHHVWMSRDNEAVFQFAEAYAAHLRKGTEKERA